MRTKRLPINLPLVAIVAEGFLSRLSFGLISFALPLYAYRLGLSLTEIGFLTSLNLVVALALKASMGWAADRFGLKRSFAVAIGLRSLVALLLAFAVVPWQLFALRTVHGMSKAIRDPAANALIAEHGGKQAVASAFAWYQTSKSLAGALGKTLAGVLLTLTASNFSVVFIVAFLLSALPLYVVARYVKEAANQPAGAPIPTTAPQPQALDTEQPSSAPERRPAILPYLAWGWSSPAQRPC
jgi:MFS family permease